jgi:hypothetical protein
MRLGIITKWLSPSHSQYSKPGALLLPRGGDGGAHLSCVRKITKKKSFWNTHSEQSELAEAATPPNARSRSGSIYSTSSTRLLSSRIIKPASLATSRAAYP